MWIVKRKNPASMKYLDEENKPLLPSLISSEIEVIEVDEISEETVNVQVARPLVGGSLLSPDVISFLAKERIKTQEYQEVREVTILLPRRTT